MGPFIIYRTIPLMACACYPEGHMSNRDTKAYVFLLISSAFFASGYLLARYYNPGSGLGMLITQALFSGALAITVVTWRVSWKIEPHHILPICFNGVVSPVILFTVWSGAMIVTPALAATIVISNAIMIAAISWAIGRKTFVKVEVFALVIGFCGVVWIGLQRGAFGGEAVGIAFLLGGAALIATITVAIERAVMEAGGVTVTRWALWSSFFVALAFTWFTGRLKFYSVEQSGLAFFMGVFSIGTSVALFNSGMSKIGAADAAVFKLLIPFFALIYGIVFLGETPNMNSAVAAVVVILSVALYQKANSGKIKKVTPREEAATR
ncbi:Permease of the drug/metabolite transporter (DMT) superfamily [hydrothermal vent metagenome]|uniref:Permease of the drug/metabolite transporter (DMT) superfamily n=1 Tax=hydrothermal vent metagenome TaxID=652676 RepID=A0A3B1BYS8_9ZZZZ